MAWSHNTARAAALAAAALTAGASQSAKAQSSVADLALYTGADRQARLLEGARREGGLTLYSSATTEDMREHIQAFEAKYGLKVKFWRGDSESILQRSVAETRGGRHEFDLLETSGGTMEAAFREDILQIVRSPALEDISPKAKFAGGAWTGTRFQMHISAYNTNAVRRQDLPKSYEELAAPRFKGKLGIELDDSEWFAAVTEWMGVEKGLAMWRDIVGKNGMSMRKGHTLIANLTASGEVPVALGVYKYKVDQMKRKGAPIDTIDMPPAVIHPIGIGLSQKAPHPHAALLFFDFMLTEGQAIYVTQDTHPTNIKIRSEPESAVYIDYARALDGGDKWQKLFKEIFGARAR